jgi:hypothetical protein
MQSKNRYSFLIASLLVIGLFYPSSMFRPVVALNTQDIMALNTNAEVLASKISLSMANVTEQKDTSDTNHTDSDLNDLDPFSTKDNGKIDKDSHLAIDKDADEKDQRNKSSTTKNVVSCEKDDKRCKNVQDILRNEDNGKNEEDGKNVKDQDISNKEQGADEETENDSGEKKSSDKFKLPIDIPFP